MKSIIAYLCLVFVLTTVAFADTPACTMPVSVASTEPAMKTMRSLVGTWEMDKPDENGKAGVISFKCISADSVVVETMFPGTPGEMMNTYHADGDRVMVTHYCAEGVQPRMKLVSTDPKDLKFEFVDGTNLKAGQGCMGGLELSLGGDKLNETWSYHNADGSMSAPMTFTLHRKG